VMAVAALALLLAPLALPVDPARVGAVRPLAYLWALLAVVLPNLVLVGALLFAVATLTRSTLATYVGGVAIYALYFVTALLIDSPLMAGTAPPTREALARAALLDPFGLSAFFEQTRYWTPAERDARPVALAGRMLLNRLLWLGVSAAVLALVYRRFTFRVGGAAGGTAR
jgi:ABC-2 type transport system permease protein